MPFRAFISFLFTSFLLRISVQVSEGILHQQVHAVGMVGGIVEVRTPTTQILRTYLHVWGDIPEQVCYEILSIAVSRTVRWQDTRFRNRGVTCCMCLKGTLSD